MVYLLLVGGDYIGGGWQVCCVVEFGYYFVVGEVLFGVVWIFCIGQYVFQLFINLNGFFKQSGVIWVESDVSIWEVFCQGVDCFGFFKIGQYVVFQFKVVEIIFFICCFCQVDYCIWCYCFFMVQVILFVLFIWLVLIGQWCCMVIIDKEQIVQYFDFVVLLVIVQQ